MSLEAPPDIPRYHLAVIAPKDFDSDALLDETLGPKVANIAHLYTNGANRRITDWALTHGIGHTVYPITCGRGLPASTRDIIEASDVVLVIETPESKSARQVADMCAARSKRDADFRWRKIAYDPVANWREKVGRVEEALAAMSEDDKAASPWLQAVEEAVR